MSRKEKIIIGILIILAIAIVVWLFLMSRGVGQKLVNSGSDNQASNSQKAANSGENSLENNKKNFQKINSQPATAEAIARSFAERFGSFSNQSDFENIIDLYPFMTAKMRAWAEDYIAKTRAKQDAASVYFGITSRALASKILKQDKDLANFRITVSRRESGGAVGEVKEYLQNIDLVLIKDAGDFWKVDKAEWQARE